MWADTVCVQVGRWLLGVRCDTEATAGVVRQLLAPHVREGKEPSVNYSVILGESGGLEPAGRGSGTQALSLLYRSSLPVVRARSAGPVLEGLVAFLSDHLDPATDPGTLLLQQAALVRDGTAVMVPWESTFELDQLEARLRRAGLRFVPQQLAVVDVETRSFTLTEPRLDHDRNVIEKVDVANPARDRDAHPGTGTYRITGWVFTATSPADVGPLTRATAVSEAAGLVVHPQLRPDELLGLLGHLLDRTPARSSSFLAGPMIAALAQIVDGLA